VGKTLEAWYRVPPDRDEPVVQVALAGRGQVWGEVRLEVGRLVVEIFGRSDGEPLVLPAAELLEVLSPGRRSMALPNRATQQTTAAGRLSLDQCSNGPRRG